MSELTWEKMIAQAEALPGEERRRHASVSRNNGHRCQECFCCACLEVEIQSARMNDSHPWSKEA